MEVNAFVGQEKPPTEDELSRALGAAKTAWDQLIADLATELDVTIPEWRCYSVKMGWSLRLKRGKRTIIWLSPLQGSFQVTFILGEKAVQAARTCGLPARILQEIDTAKKYPEGTGVRLAVRGVRELGALKKLARVKLAN